MPEENENTEDEETGGEQTSRSSSSSRKWILIIAAGVLLVAAIAVGVYVAIDNPEFFSGTTSDGVKAVTDGNFDELVIKSNAPALVFFTASWCGPGRQVEPYLPALASKYAGRFNVFRLDIDPNPSVQKTYGINNLPTILFFKDGQKVDQIVGAVPQSRIEEKIGTLLGITVPIIEQNKSGKVPFVTAAQFDQEVVRSDRPVLVLFGDSGTDTALNLHWCGLAAEEHQGNIKVCRVDSTKESSLAGTYSVTTIPTMLIFKGGQVIDKIEGKLTDRWRLFDKLFELDR